MNETGPDTSDTFHDGPDDISPENVLPQSAREPGSAEQQYPRRRHRIRVLVTAVAVVAAALAAVVTAALRAAPAAPSPLSLVTSALARTSAESYTFSLDSTTLFTGKELNWDVVSGAFDPRHNLGTELLTSRSAGQTDRAQIRFIRKYLYTWVSPGSGFPTMGKPWDKTPSAAAAAGMPPGDTYGFVSDQPVSPDALAVVLRSAGAKVHDSGPVSGQGWTGTKYTFTALLYDGQESVNGTVYVDRQGRVRRLMTITTEKARRRHATNAARLTTDRDLTFGDFGAPVPVTAPPANKVKYTSGKPYWGFYF